MGSETGLNRRFIISASRRTDLVACEPDRLVAILRGKMPFARSVVPTRVHTLLVSTKDFRNLLDNPRLRQVCTEVDQLCLNLTITGLGSSALEPNVPHPSVLLSRLPELATFVGDPRRISWCFDPILRWQGVSNVDRKHFASIGDHFARIGAQRVFAMFFFPYKNARIVPDVLTSDEKAAFAASIDETANGLGLQLSFCHMPPLHRMKCVDLDWLVELHPTHDDGPVCHYRRAKKPNAAYCRDAVWDVGWYLPACRHGCRYCYGSAQIGDDSAVCPSNCDHDTSS